MIKIYITFFIGLNSFACNLSSSLGMSVRVRMRVRVRVKVRTRGDKSRIGFGLINVEFFLCITACFWGFGGVGVEGAFFSRVIGRPCVLLFLGLCAILSSVLNLL